MKFVFFNENEPTAFYILCAQNWVCILNKAVGSVLDLLLGAKHKSD